MYLVIRIFTILEIQLRNKIFKSCFVNLVVGLFMPEHHIVNTAMRLEFPRHKNNRILIADEHFHGCRNNANIIISDNPAYGIEPLISYFKQELLKEQSKLDNHGNYQMEGDLCKYVNRHKK